MHIEFIHDDARTPTGPIIYAYFEPGLVGLVFEEDREGHSWGGRPDSELPDLFWFDIVGGALVANDGIARSWELIA